MPLPEARARLSASQDAIVRALFESTAPPPGFHPDVLERARRKLAEKRAWVEARRARRARRAPTLLSRFVAMLRR
jgi:hypothetical protein